MKLPFMDRRHKYNARKVRADGYTFDSQMEHRRYCELKILARSGHITDLVVHPVYPLTVCGVQVAKYIGDFSYREAGKLVVDDSKGVQTQEFRLKAKLFQVLYPHAEFRINGSVDDVPRVKAARASA